MALRIKTGLHGCVHRSVGRYQHFKWYLLPPSTGVGCLSVKLEAAGSSRMCCLCADSTTSGDESIRWLCFTAREEHSIFCETSKFWYCPKIL